MTLKNTALEQKVMHAQPHELVLMMYDGCIAFISKGEAALVKKDFEATNTYLQKAEKILLEFNDTLDMQFEISQQLSPLYCYTYNKLVEGNITSDLNKLREAKSIISELRDAWYNAIQTLKESA